MQTTVPDCREQFLTGHVCNEMIVVCTDGKLQWRRIAVVVHLMNYQRHRLVLVGRVTFAKNAICQVLIRTTKFTGNTFSRHHKVL